MSKRSWLLVLAATGALLLVMFAASRGSELSRASEASSSAQTGSDVPRANDAELVVPVTEKAHAAVADANKSQPAHDSHEQASSPRAGKVLASGATLLARVLDTNGKPLAGARVRLEVHPDDISRLPGRSGHDTDAAQALQWNAETDEDGRCVIADLPSGVRMQPQLARGANARTVAVDELTFFPSEMRKVEWPLEDGFDLRGVVLDQDEHAVAKLELFLQRPLPGLTPEFEVYDESAIVARVRTDERGRFVLKSVPAGTWWLGPQPPGGPNDNARTAAALAIIVEVTPESARPEIVLHVQSSLFIRGHVLDPNGAAAAGQWVGAKETDKAIPLSAVSLADGSFSVGPLRAGKFELFAGGPGGPQDNAFIAPSDSVSAQAGAEGVVLQLKLGGSISGRVLDRRTGAGVAGRLWLAPRIAKSFLLVEGTSTGDGSFQFEHLHPGTYDVGAESGHALCGLMKSVVVEPSFVTKNVDIQLEPTAKLHVRYDGAFERASVSVKVDGVRIPVGGIVSRGASSDLAVPTGRSTLEIYLLGSGLLPEQTIELAPGEERELVIHDPP